MSYCPNIMCTTEASKKTTDPNILVSWSGHLNKNILYLSYFKAVSILGLPLDE